MLKLIQGGLSKNSLAHDDVWDEELRRLRRRANRIVALQRGEAQIKKVKVQGVWVKRHFRRNHDRLLIQLTGRDNSASQNSTRDKKGK